MNDMQVNEPSFSKIDSEKFLPISSKNQINTVRPVGIDYNESSVLV